MERQHFIYAFFVLLIYMAIRLGRPTSPSWQWWVVWMSLLSMTAVGMA
jgi:hypothetical protein